VTRTILDIHILQNVPPSNINRDDTGTPKSAHFGGVRRARVSSQAWKRATRQAFNGLLPPEELGVRTKKVAEALAERIVARNASLQPVAIDLAAAMLTAATGSKIEPPKRKAKAATDNGEDVSAAPESSYLMFLSRRQLDALAELAIAGSGPNGEVKVLQEHLKAKENKAQARQAVDTRHSVDIALFGRMVADAADLNVEAATQVAHAISVHKSDIESDYYTAVDDLSRDHESGAGMIGTIDFNSATLYRYAAVDIDELQRNLGLGLRDDEEPTTPVEKAVGAFLEAFITSLPTGKINTFGNHTLPSAVIVKLRDRWPISFAGAFEEPVPQGTGGGFLRAACNRLAAYVPEVEKQYDITSEDNDGSWVFRVGEETKELAALGSAVTLKTLVKDVSEAVRQRMQRVGSGT
jgi:CRISPR system Cascade subunit CasC